MTTQSYQPQVNLTAVEPAAREKWRLGMLVALAILGALALVFMYYRWFGNIQPANAAATTAQRKGVKAVSPKRRRENEVAIAARWRTPSFRKRHKDYSELVDRFFY